QVRAPLGAAPRPASAAAAEEHVEEVEGGVEAEATHVGHAVAGVAEGVVALALLGIAEAGVGLPHLLEPLLGLLVPLVAVGVVLHGEPPVGLLQILGPAVPADPQHLVVVALGHRYRVDRGAEGWAIRTMLGRITRSWRR